jgi:hypothetical protein
MDTNQPTLNENTPPVADAARPPFNEVSVLFPLLALYTVTYMGLMVAEFVLRGALMIPTGMLPVYITLVGAYAADKEIRRWAVKDQPSRKGALFVYLWAIFYMVAFLVHTFRPDFAVPGELTKVVVQVVGIFFGSLASKLAYNKWWKDDPEVVSQRQSAILEMIKTRGRIKNSDVVAQLGISRATAQRLLADMAAGGSIRQVGERKAAYYEAAGK